MSNIALLFKNLKSPLSIVPTDPFLSCPFKQKSLQEMSLSAASIFSSDPPPLYSLNLLLSRLPKTPSLAKTSMSSSYLTNNSNSVSIALFLKHLFPGLWDIISFLVCSPHTGQFFSVSFLASPLPYLPYLWKLRVPDPIQFRGSKYQLYFDDS